jgi:hypothetical protein
MTKETVKKVEKICQNCHFWQRGYHRPGDPIPYNQDGKCLYEPTKVTRFEKDIACSHFELQNTNY